MMRADWPSGMQICAPLHVTMAGTRHNMTIKRPALYGSTVSALRFLLHIFIYIHVAMIPSKETSQYKKDSAYACRCVRERVCVTVCDRQLCPYLWTAFREVMLPYNADDRASVTFDITVAERKVDCNSINCIFN